MNAAFFTLNGAISVVFFDLWRQTFDAAIGAPPLLAGGLSGE
jgi:hypothetical protein